MFNPDVPFQLNLRLIILRVRLLISQHILPQNNTPQKVHHDTQCPSKKRWPRQSKDNTTHIVKQQHLRETTSNTSLSTIISIGLHIPWIWVPLITITIIITVQCYQDDSRKKDSSLSLNPGSSTNSITNSSLSLALQNVCTLFTGIDIVSPFVRRISFPSRLNLAVPDRTWNVSSWFLCQCNGGRNAIFLFSGHDAGGQVFITRYFSPGDLNVIEERPLSKRIFLRGAV